MGKSVYKSVCEPFGPSGRLVRARDFISSHGGLLERRLFQALFCGGPPEPVLELLRGPAEFVLEVLDSINALAPQQLASVRELDRRASAALTREGDVDWQLVGMVGLLHKHGVGYPWLAEATRLCRESIEAYLMPPVGSGGQPPNATEIEPMLIFLEHAEPRASTQELLRRLGGLILEWDLVCFDPTDGSAQRTPLDWAPTPWSPCRPLFADEQIEWQLAVLLSGQRGDGGWPAAGRSRIWRTIVALRTLCAYDVLDSCCEGLPASRPDFR